jgi:hypothetical protein
MGLRSASGTFFKIKDNTILLKIKKKKKKSLCADGCVTSRVVR